MSTHVILVKRDQPRDHYRLRLPRTDGKSGNQLSMLQQSNVD